MFISTIFISATLSLIASIHIYWLMGGNWPGTDRRDLIDRVVGRGDQYPSPAINTVVIAVFLLMAVLPWVQIGSLPSPLDEKVTRGVTYFFAAVFLLRGSVGYLPQVQIRATAKFNTLNTRIYSPLCLSLGIAELFLVL